jgi:hypothetical protein
VLPPSRMACMCVRKRVYMRRAAKHLVAGNPLESLLPLSDGNICEELV